MPMVQVKTYSYVEQDFNGDWMATGMGIPSEQNTKIERIITENIDTIEAYRFVGKNTFGREVRNVLQNFHTVKMRDGTEYHVEQDDFEVIENAMRR